jgi:hypothetical protein
MTPERTLAPKASAEDLRAVEVRELLHLRLAPFALPRLASRALYDRCRTLPRRRDGRFQMSGRVLSPAPPTACSS